MDKIQIMLKIPFDTLKYVTMLKNGGIENSEIHAISLSDAMTQNMYVKNEVDDMIDEALKRSDRAIAEFRENIVKDRAEHEKKIMLIENRMENRFEKNEHVIDNKINMAINKGINRLTINIGVMVSILTAVSLVLHYIH